MPTIKLTILLGSFKLDPKLQVFCVGRGKRVRSAKNSYMIHDSAPLYGVDSKSLVRGHRKNRRNSVKEEVEMFVIE